MSAPSLNPRLPGAGVKLERWGALKLGGLFRAGEVTEIVPPYLPYTYWWIHKGTF